MVKRAEELAEKHGWFLARQFENPANPEYHRNTTGTRDPARLRQPPARLLGHRLGHGRNAHGRGQVIKARGPR
jgi:cysteine synthase A